MKKPASLAKQKRCAGETVTEVQKQVEQSSCTNASLEGAYGFVRTGTGIAGPTAALGLATYDGAGNDVARQTISQNGVFTSSGTFPGRYDVSADCRGRLLFNGQQIARIVLVASGTELLVIGTNPGVTVTAVQRKVNRGGMVRNDTRAG